MLCLHSYISRQIYNNYQYHTIATTEHFMSIWLYNNVTQEQKYYIFQVSFNGLLPRSVAGHVTGCERVWKILS